MYEFKNVDLNNFEQVIALKISDEQKGFLENNIYSLAQAKVNEKLIPKAIYKDDILIGFALYNFIKDEEDIIFLKRYMIDENFQGKGYGKGALSALLDYYKETYDLKAVELMHYQENTLAEKLYKNADFKATGEIRDTEIVRRFYY